MSPFIRPGDSIIVSPFAGRKPVVGQMVAFTHPKNGMLLVHRVVSKKENEFLIQGDNMSGLDDGMIPAEKLLGVVSGVFRNEKKVWFGGGWSGYFVAILSRSGLLTPIVSWLRKTLKGN